MSALKVDMLADSCGKDNEKRKASFRILLGRAPHPPSRTACRNHVFSDLCLKQYNNLLDRTPRTPPGSIQPKTACPRPQCGDSDGSVRTVALGQAAAFSAANLLPPRVLWTGTPSPPSAGLAAGSRTLAHLRPSAGLVRAPPRAHLVAVLLSLLSLLVVRFAHIICFMLITLGRRSGGRGLHASRAWRVATPWGALSAVPIYIYIYALTLLSTYIYIYIYIYALTLLST